VNASERKDVERWRRAMASVRGSAARDVDAARIFDAVHGRLAPAERRAVIDELAANEHVGEVWRLAQELTPAPAQAQVGRGGRRWLSMAAAVALASTLGWQGWQQWPSAADPAYRDIDAPTITADAPAGGTLSRSSPALRWTALEGARYRVRIFSEELELREESPELTRPEYRLGAPLLDAFPPGARLLWQVEARVPGSPRIMSPTFTVRLE
jgi:hypothetical protein